MHSATRQRLTTDQFKECLKNLTSSLPKHQRRHFIGSRRTVFQSPGSHGRHGLAPAWDDASHNAACVIRGRIRFGVSFDPRFHYDCQIPRRRSMVFPGCHEPEKITNHQGHVNVAPNDNVERNSHAKAWLLVAKISDVYARIAYRHHEFL